jgi:glycosyltransferase involved in cell wall biosynthesis
VTRVLLYSPANLNVVDGSSIWVQSVAETLHVGPEVEVVLPLRAPVRRDVITRLLRRLPRVELLEPDRASRWRSPYGLGIADALDLIERLDRHRPFDAIVLRSFELCLAAVERPRLRDRLWSCYVLEPERGIDDPTYLAEMARIAVGSRYLVAQSEEMRALTEWAVPAARGRTILLPPAIPAAPAHRADPDRIVRRLIYTGKFHPFYQVDRLVEVFGELRAALPELEFHVVGDKIHRPKDDAAYAPSVEQALTSTPGLVWHGAIPRDEVEALVARGGIALSLWDYRHGSRMNDLVISTKVLDYASVGVPVVLNRTAAQETMLGADYPLFVRRADEALPLLRRLFTDPALYRVAAEATFSGSRAFTYPAVFDRLEPFLAGPGPRADAALLDRAKLPGAAWNVGLLGTPAGPDRRSAASDLASALGARDERYRLVAFEPPADDLASWLRCVGPVIVAPDDRVAAEAVRAAGSRPIALTDPAAAVATILGGRT